MGQENQPQHPRVDHHIWQPDFPTDHTANNQPVISGIGWDHWRRIVTGFRQERLENGCHCSGNNDLMQLSQVSLKIRPTTSGLVTLFGSVLVTDARSLSFQRTEEIELEIDLLPANVLIKLYNFVIRPLKAAQPKRARTGKGTGTGGLKQKSMDEDVEAEKIRALEARIALFEKNSTTTVLAEAPRAGGANRGGDRSSDSNNSGSDSE